MEISIDNTHQMVLIGTFSILSFAGIGFLLHHLLRQLERRMERFQTSIDEVRKETLTRAEILTHVAGLHAKIDTNHRMVEKRIEECREKRLR
uniref:Uncharacterized protein n=1 Tax=Candidatus Kentrum sp. TC TaxID=2126339 RepID=A0A450YYM6_9GAMM|nr:MAG: hypothetical protein BECKTC1821E_GA0114239_106724 [Candidatus Kentron sp. TC]